MSHLSDKDIDRLSREAAEVYQPDDNMLSWNKLEQQLVIQLPEHPPESGTLFRMRPLIWGPVVLLVTGITYYTIKNSTHRSNSTLKARTENTIPKTEKAQDQSSDELTTPNRLPRSRAGENTAQETIVPGAIASGTANGKTDRELHSGVNNISSRMPFAAVKNETQYSLSGVTPDESAARLPLPVILHGDPDVRGSDSMLNRFAQNKAKEATPSKTLQVNRSLSIGIVMGPDYTQAGGTTNDQLSNNIGISLGYYINRRLSINTGIQYTTKYYWAEGKPFQPVPLPNSGIAPYGSFPRIESVNGSCSMIEIPLTLRYDFLRQGKTRLFVNAGLSSYLLRQQDYTYYFHNAGRAYEWQNENTDHLNYWFAVADLSAGLEQAMGRGFSFQVEPFARLPLRGMGIADMKMNSFGFLFSIRYAPVLGRTRK